MKIIVDKDIPYIQGRFPQHTEVVYLPGNKITPRDVEGASALIVRTRTHCDESLLKDSGVRLVATATIGTDHIDIPWCEAHGISVRSAPGCNAPGVAQYVFASLFRAGFNSHAHTLGIVGFGNVGSLVGEWAKKMGISILVSDPPRSESGYFDEDYKSLNEVLENSDAVTLHVPFTNYGLHPTYHLIGTSELQRMKPEPILVNTSRGGVVEENALKENLKAGTLKAIVDVWENEPQIDPQLLDMALIATPHIAGYSVEGKKRGTGMALQAVKEVLGIETDLTGLECIPPNDTEISRPLVESSYNPFFDTQKLKENPRDFESLRNNYNYRHEPLFAKS